MRSSPPASASDAITKPTAAPKCGAGSPPKCLRFTGRPTLRLEAGDDYTEHNLDECRISAPSECRWWCVGRRQMCMRRASTARSASRCVASWLLYRAFSIWHNVSLDAVSLPVMSPFEPRQQASSVCRCVTANSPPSQPSRGPPWLFQLSPDYNTSFAEAATCARRWATATGRPGRTAWTSGSATGASRTAATTLPSGMS